MKKDKTRYENLQHKEDVYSLKLRDIKNEFLESDYYGLVTSPDWDSNWKRPETDEHLVDERKVIIDPQDVELGPLPRVEAIKKNRQRLDMYKKKKPIFTPHSDINIKKSPVSILVPKGQKKSTHKKVFFIGQNQIDSIKEDDEDEEDEEDESPQKSKGGKRKSKKNRKSKSKRKNKRKTKRRK